MVLPSVRRTSPVVRVRSRPPPGTTLEALPAPEPPAISTFIGELK